MTNFSRFVIPTDEGNNLIHMQIGGMHCAACVRRIETALNDNPAVRAHVNLSTQRLTVVWRGGLGMANDFATRIMHLGFDVAPFDAATQTTANAEDDLILQRCLVVAGFASLFIMLLMLVQWFSWPKDIVAVNHSLLHWTMAFIALPTIAYAGRPFFYSAWAALKGSRTNMDVPISLAVVLAALMSLYETIRNGPYVYFDSSVMLIFFLLLGRYLDKKARGKARDAAQKLLATMVGNATQLDDGVVRPIALRDVKQDMILLVAAGERIPVDCIVAGGVSDVDTSLVTGETVLQAVAPGMHLYAGMINLSGPLTVRVLAVHDKSLVADIVALMEKAEQTQGRYVRLADRVASWYTPVVHGLALVTFGGWLLGGAVWQVALMNATAVLIITCPCALGLAIPIVQVVASSRLFKRGTLLKTGDALEKLAHVDTVVFDKTGTLTTGTPVLQDIDRIDPARLQLAASLAIHSKHPLSCAVAAAWAGETIELTVKEVPAHGLEAEYDGRTLRLGRRGWCGAAALQDDDALELWLNDGSASPLRLTFSDVLRTDAKDIVATLRAAGMHTAILSGDRPAVVSTVAATLGIDELFASVSPVDKTAIIQRMQQAGRKVLMVGDGLNDAAALATADVSMSPASGIDITQNAADLVFQGKLLAPVVGAISIARHAAVLVKQNLILALAYNLFAVPIAVAGFTTPLIAAVAMSSSSLIVVINALRLGSRPTDKF